MEQDTETPSVYRDDRIAINRKHARRLRTQALWLTAGVWWVVVLAAAVTVGLASPTLALWVTLTIFGAIAVLITRQTLRMTERARDFDVIADEWESGERSDQPRELRMKFDRLSRSLDIAEGNQRATDMETIRDYLRRCKNPQHGHPGWGGLECAISRVLDIPRGGL